MTKSNENAPLLSKEIAENTSSIISITPFEAKPYDWETADSGLADSEQLEAPIESYQDTASNIGRTAVTAVERIDAMLAERNSRPSHIDMAEIISGLQEMPPLVSARSQN